MRWVKAVLVISFIVAMGLVSFRLVLDPVSWRHFFDKRGWWIGPMAYTESRLGRLQLRVVGGVMLAVLLFMLVVVIKAVINDK